MHLVIVEHRHMFAKLLDNVFRMQNPVELVILAKLGGLGLVEQLTELATLCTNRVGMILPDFYRYVLYLCGGLDNGSKNGYRHCF